MEDSYLSSRPRSYRPLHSFVTHRLSFLTFSYRLLQPLFVFVGQLIPPITLPFGLQLIDDNFHQFRIALSCDLDKKQ